MYYLYVIQEDRDGFVKIGYSSNIEDRLKQLQSANPHKLSVLYEFSYDDLGIVRTTEEKLHEHFKHTRFKGEWFKFTNYMKDFFDLWSGSLNEIDDDVRETLKDFANHIFQILCTGLGLCDYGNHTAAQALVNDLRETIDDVQRYIPDLKNEMV